MSTRKLSYQGKYSIVWNNREVVMDLEASAYSWYQKGSYYEPEDWGIEVDDFTITNAYYVDTGDLIPAEEIEDEVGNKLAGEDDYFWGNIEEDHEDSDGMDCVDRWNVAHGIEV